MKKGLPPIFHVLWIFIFVLGFNAYSQDRKTEIRKPIKKEQLKSPSSQETMTQTVPAQLLEPNAQDDDADEKGNAIIPPPVEQEKVTPEPPVVEAPSQEAPVQKTPPVTTKPKVQVVTPQP